MPSPVVLRVDFDADGPALDLPPNAKRVGDSSVEFRWPVDVWFDGKRTFAADLDFGKGRISKITFDPHRRFPDRDTTDNTWTRR